MGERIVLDSDLTGALDKPEDPVRARGWGWEGRPLRIDLSDSEYKRFADAVAPYLAASRPAEESKTRTAGRKPREGQSDGSKAKAWANTHGAELSARGPCPDAVLAAWKADDASLLPHRSNGHAPATADE